MAHLVILTGPDGSGKSVRASIEYPDYFKHEYGLQHMQYTAPVYFAELGTFCGLYQNVVITHAFVSGYVYDKYLRGSKPTISIEDIKELLQSLTAKYGKCTLTFCIPATLGIGWQVLSNRGDDHIKKYSDYVKIYNGFSETYHILKDFKVDGLTIDMFSISEV